MNKSLCVFSEEVELQLMAIGNLASYVYQAESAELQLVTDGQKHHLLKNHDKRSKHYIFPVQKLGGCNSSFKFEWLQQYGWWLVYSTKLDLCCVLCLIH